MVGKKYIICAQGFSTVFCLRVIDLTCVISKQDALIQCLSTDNDLNDSNKNNSWLVLTTSGEYTQITQLKQVSLLHTSMH